MTPKVENYCINKGARTVVIGKEERACINCIWYEQYYRRNRGNIASWVPICMGNCLLHDKHRSPLAKPCKEFEREGEER